jgi:hypothetical protein
MVYFQISGYFCYWNIDHFGSVECDAVFQLGSTFNKEGKRNGNINDGTDNLF